jgi:hypothetical protein
MKKKIIVKKNEFTESDSNSDLNSDSEIQTKAKFQKRKKTIKKEMVNEQTSDSESEDNEKIQNNKKSKILKSINIKKNMKNNKIIDSENISKKNDINNIYTVLTEEVPLSDEIQFIIKNILNINTEKIYTIDPIFTTKDEFKGEWEIKCENIKIIIKLFKGESSCCDYLIFNGNVDDNTNAGSAICILESTKTGDKSSRNTAVNQRITKFMVYQKMFPLNNAKKIMFYNQLWNKKDLSDTAILGLRLMKSLNIDCFHGENNKFENLFDLYKINKLSNIDDLITEKNKIKEKKGNVSVKIINEKNNNFTIHCKLDKGNDEKKGMGKMSHDPNVGLLAGLINFIYQSNNKAKILIKEHGLTQDYFDKNPNSKFWHSVNGILIIFDNINNIVFPVLPKKYFKIESDSTEKLSTILMSQLCNKKYNCIFSNHSGCALTNIKKNTNNNEYICVEKSMPRPDIVFFEGKNNDIIIIEGKIEKDIQKGITQLSDKNLSRFEELLKKEYKNCSIKKGLCITIDDIKNIKKYEDKEYPILFALDNNGKYINNLN